MEVKLKIDIKSLNLDQLKKVLKEHGEKSFRADQIYQWLHQKLVKTPSQMYNLSISLRDKLQEIFQFVNLEILECIESKQDDTKKYLFRLPDGNIIESVLMKYDYGNSVCISSQAGCRMGCKFCASGIGGLVRNLLPSEILEQVYRIQDMTGERISGVVVMGTGEPLDNYENLLSFIKILTDENGLHISQRNITISTCGLVEQIRRLADEKLSITLALSLHAADDETRKKIMPISSKYSISQTLSACDYYFQTTGRRVTYEYSLMEGINDGEEDAKRLSALLFQKNHHVNLIPINPVKERNYKRSGASGIQKFKNLLEKNRINVTIRREMGSDIDAACGQLRRRYAELNCTEGGELHP